MESFLSVSMFFYLLLEGFCCPNDFYENKSSGAFNSLLCCSVEKEIWKESRRAVNFDVIIPSFFFFFLRWVGLIALNI